MGDVLLKHFHGLLIPLFCAFADAAPPPQWF
jgi:hypothetical protein